MKTNEDVIREFFAPIFEAMLVYSQVAAASYSYALTLTIGFVVAGYVIDKTFLKRYKNSSNISVRKLVQLIYVSFLVSIVMSAIRILNAEVMSVVEITKMFFIGILTTMPFLTLFYIIVPRAEKFWEKVEE